MCLAPIGPAPQTLGRHTPEAQAGAVRSVVLPVHIKLGLCNKAEYHPRWSVLLLHCVDRSFTTLVRFLVIIVTPASKTAPKTAPRQPFSSTSPVVRQRSFNVQHSQSAVQRINLGTSRSQLFGLVVKYPSLFTISPRTRPMGVSASRLFHVSDNVARRYLRSFPVLPARILSCLETLLGIEFPVI